MWIIRNTNTNPYFNIASEEYLLHRTDQDCFMLYRNEPSIIIGKHQNTLAEINYPYVKENGIQVIRRLSGGGTVFHDLGNINFTFIAQGEEGKLVDFRRFTQPLIEVLQSYGVKAVFGGNNDLRVDGYKISGNAEHVFKRRTLHHGTLLFSSELENLGSALKVKQGVYKDKAVKSVRSIVTNILEKLAMDTDIHKFMDSIYRKIEAGSPGAVCYSFSREDRKAISSLMEEKYQTWKWNYGYSPSFEISNAFEYGGSRNEIRLVVEKGLIATISVTGNLQNFPQCHAFEKELKGLEHKESQIVHAMAVSGLNRVVGEERADEFVLCFIQ